MSRLRGVQLLRFSESIAGGVKLWWSSGGCCLEGIWALGNNGRGWKIQGVHRLFRDEVEFEGDSDGTVRTV